MPLAAHSITYMEESTSFYSWMDVLATEVYNGVTVLDGVIVSTKINNLIKLRPCPAASNFDE